MTSLNLKGKAQTLFGSGPPTFMQVWDGFVGLGGGVDGGGGGLGGVGIGGKQPMLTD